MRIVGIDPGYAIVGFGVVDYDRPRFDVIDYGAITTDAETEFNTRLMEIYNDTCVIFDTYKPELLKISTWI